MFRECSHLLYGRKFALRLKGAVYRSYVRSTILCANVIRERSMVRAMCGIRLKDRKKSTYLMLNLGFDGTMHQLTMATELVGIDMC